MIEKYLVDPRDLGRLGPMWMLLEQFGVSKGRMISELPSKWLRTVHDAARQADCPDIERKSIEERLKRLKHALVKSPQISHLANGDWLENALHAQANGLIRAIVSEVRDGRDTILNPLHATDDHPLWKVVTACAIQRNLQEITATAAPLGDISKELLFVDPYISYDRNYMRPILAILKASGANERTFRKIELHMTEKCGELDCFAQHFQKYVLAQLGKPQSVTLVKWQNHAEGDKMHPRYLLTERGGMRFDYGFAEGKPGQTTDVQLLSDELYQRRWKEYQGNSTTFNLLEKMTVPA